MDDPHMIVEGALENHYKMIKQFKGQLLLVHAQMQVNTMRATRHFNGARIFIAQHHVPLKWRESVYTKQRASLVNILSYLAADTQRLVCTSLDNQKSCLPFLLRGLLGSHCELIHMLA